MNEKISPEDWGEFVDEFSQKNQNRLVTIEVVSQTMGDEPLVERLPLIALDFDPRADQEFLITIGEGGRTFTHVIKAPREVYLSTDEMGKALALSIRKEKRDQLILRFED